MDWYRHMLLLAMALVPFVHSWSPIPSSQRFSGRRRNEVSPYLDLVLCPIREQPWSCARQQSGRILDVWDNELHSQWQKLKVEADIQLNSTLERRGYSNSQFVTKEKPSTILKKIEIGTDYMKEYLAETMDGFLGKEYEYTHNFKNHNEIQNDQPIDNDEPADDVDENDDDEDDNDTDDDNEDNDDDVDDVDDDGQSTAAEDEEETEGDDNTGDVKNTDITNDGTATGDEFIDIEAAQDEQTIGQLKKPGGGNKRRKNKKKKKGDQHDIASQAANLLVIQPLEHQLAQQHDHDDGHDDGHAKPIRKKVKPLKQKRRKRKKKGQAGDDDITTVVVEQQPSSDHLSLGLLEELANVDLLDEGGKRKKRPMKYGRSNGVTRGKKKKKKKALMKLMLLGSFLKAKIELLLKILGAHLQIKFFAIALIGLLINIARFWIDVKRGGAPQKVVYVEHAHHQHHYEDHGEDWNESGGGYWKRSLQTDTPGDDYDSATDSYQLRPHQAQQQQPYDGQYMAYRNQWQRK